jgi:outer membrane protein assembly factor BamA
MLRLLLWSTLFLLRVHAQNSAFPLESVSLEGTELSREFVLEIAGLRIGAPIDKAGIEAACAKLRDSGVFASLSYQYRPGPKRGYALSLTAIDHGTLVDAQFDLPGVDENELWKWVTSWSPAFDRKVPENGAAQQFIARKIEQQLGAKLDGQRVVTRMEADLERRRMIVSFQPEALPGIASMSFTGNREFTSEALTALIQKIVGAGGYTDRHFRMALELNVRRVYEEHGFYRVRFPSVAVRKASASSVEITTAIEEGTQYRLGEVQLIGDKLPVDAMLEAADFKKGEIANWTEIQNGIWAMERPLKRTGYFRAEAKPERILHDDRRVLDLRIPFSLGPLYRFGQLRITGLSPALEAQALKVWSLRPGDPFDYDYPSDFFREFSQTADRWQFKKLDAKMQQGAGENVMDFTLVFAP